MGYNKTQSSRIAQGICYLCGKEETRRGMITCEGCIVKKTEYRRSNPKSLAEFNWRKHGILGMTWERYEEMLAEQGGRCFLCRDLPGKHRLAVDHNHETGEPRRLLCILCNHAVERLENHNGWGAKALKYLEEYSRGKE
jgi:Recombination endonuclease VII